jgi:hypothetical protein
MAKLFATGMSGQAGENGEEETREKREKEGKEGKRAHGRLLEHERMTAIEPFCHCRFYSAASRS